MKQIWKYQLEIADKQMIVTPANTRVLYSGLQSGTICIWCLVDPDAQQQERTVYIFGTGHDIPDTMTEREYYGSVLMTGDALVWHIFVSKGGNLV